MYNLQYLSACVFIQLDTIIDYIYLSIYLYLLTCNNCIKQDVGQTVFTISRITTDLTLVNIHIAYHACRNTCSNIFVIVNIVKHTLKTFAPYGFNIKKRCVAVSLLVLISFTWIGFLCVVVAAFTFTAYNC